MSVDYWEKVEDATWWEVVENCDYATFYHTPAWHYLVSEAMEDSQIKTVGGELKNGTRFVFPMMTAKQVGPFYGLVSSAGNVYGGIIADGPITEKERRGIYQNVVDNWWVISFRALPGPSRQFDSQIKNFVPGFDKTFVISLSQGLDQIYQNYSRGHKSAIKKARKAGVEVTVADTLEDYQAYHQVYLDSLDRWGDSFMGGFIRGSMLEKIYELAQEMPDRIKLWVGRVENKIISGALIFYWNKSIVYYHGANHREYFSYRAANLIQNEILTHAVQADLGYEYYDFGPSGTSSGVLEFKRRFGGDEQPISWWFYSPPFLLALHKLRDKFSRYLFTNNNS